MRKLIPYFLNFLVVITFVFSSSEILAQSTDLDLSKELGELSKSADNTPESRTDTIDGFVTLTERAAIFFWMPCYAQVDTVTMFHSVCA